MIFQQQSNLLNEITAKQVRAGHGSAILPRPCNMTKTQPTVGLQKAGRGHPDFRIIGAIMLLRGAIAHRLGKPRGQIVSRQIVE